MRPRSTVYITTIAAKIPRLLPLLASIYTVLTSRLVTPFPLAATSSARRRAEQFWCGKLHLQYLSWLARRLRQLGGATVPDSTPKDLPVGTLPKGVEDPVARHRPDLHWRDALKRPRNGQPAVMFLHHSYYHFYYLAAALRKRGWHALSVSYEPPNSPNQMYYHGEDLNLYDPDEAVMRSRLQEMYAAIPQNFDMVHWHAESMMGVFPENFSTMQRIAVPWDFLELRRRGVKLGFSMSGCLTGTRQSDFNRATGGVCNKCVWQLDPLVCSDVKNHAYGKLLGLICDLVAVEGDWPIASYRRTPRAFLEPLTYCLDPQLWHEDLEVPREMQFERNPNDVLIFHSVGNFDTRARLGRNIKGTGAVLSAIERLQAEGIPARLVFKTGVPSREMRFYQVQADIVVDQLNYGRYGATSRECMMLGRPTITRLVREQPLAQPASPSLQECPLVSADESTIYHVLKDLCLSPERRAKIGRDSRQYALKWHSADACAERFERVFENVKAKVPLRTGIY